MENLVLEVDDSVNASASFPHRWPGRWASDGAMTSGQATLTTSNAEISCGDIGQAILVKGAGVAGADLSTTISSVTPCWDQASSRTVTLAASASTTVSGALVYISVAGLPATQTMGNCALGADNYDGNSAHWTMSGGPSDVYDVIRDVQIGSTSGTFHGKNYSCSIYLSGAWQPYGLDTRNLIFAGVVFGPVEAGPDTNPNSGYIGSDYQKWDHIKFSTTYPWISYNGAFEVFDSVQFDSVYGPQILRVLSSGGENQPYNWQISMPEMENTTGSVGWRIMGQGMTVNRATLCSTSAPGIIDTDFSTFSNTACGGNLYVYGETNTVNFSGNDTNTSYMLGVTDGGAGNTVNGAYNSSPYQQRQATVNQAYTRSRGKDYVNGTVTPDFVRSGNVSTPYFSDKDLFFWPEDMLWNGAGANVFSDATSLTSRYIKIPSSARISRFKGFIGDNANIGNSAAGSQVPAANVAVYVSAKCPSITSYTLAVYAGATSVTSATFTCTASYTTQQIPVNLSSYSGQTLQFNFSAGEVDVAWIAVRPYQTDYNGYQPSDSTGVWTANARSWSWSGSGHPGNADGTSPYGFSTSLSPAWALTYVNGSNNLNGGAIYRPVPSTVSYLVAAPTVLTDTLGAAMASGDTSITLAAGTTSSWANNGCLQVDQEIVCYSGTPAVGTTTLTVTRGQYGTLAQAHSNGATLSSVGTGTFYTACNSVNYAVTNVVFTPAWTYFKSPFAAQNCSGYATSFKLGAGNGPTGQLYNIAAVQVAQAPQIGTATAANQVPLSSGSGPYTWTSTKAVTGSGAAVHGPYIKHIRQYCHLHGNLRPATGQRNGACQCPDDGRRKDSFHRQHAQWTSIRLPATSLPGSFA